MIRHLRYWWARIRNDFLRLCLLGPNESQFVEEIMLDLRRDLALSKLIDEKQQEIDRSRNERAEGGR